jgi:two-component system response regulator HydG
MTARPTIIVVDDHVEMARVVAEKFEELEWNTEVAESGRAAIARIPEVSPDLVITDLRMGDVDGLDVLAAARAHDPELPVILMTAFGGIDSAIEAMRGGAWHYLTKPLRLDELILHAKRALEQRSLRRENQALRAANRTGLEALVGRSSVMRDLFALIESVAPSPASVLVEGESGTGKELVARAIHDIGPRRRHAFVAINCTALPESLLESELFGHTRGAFTGATTARAGVFVEASGGTLFLDEIGDMAPALQAKLLRVIQHGEVRALGSDESRQVDVRIIAATHQDLHRKVEEGQFRADLYYRLNVVPIKVPPLRDRLEDLGLLCEHFLARARGRNPHSVVERLGRGAIDHLAAYSWPGNVRELENLFERLVVIGSAPEIDVERVRSLVPLEPNRFAFARGEKLATLREVEDEYIAWVLARCGNSKARAAEILGLDPSTLHRRARRQ